MRRAAGILALCLSLFGCAVSRPAAERLDASLRLADSIRGGEVTPMHREIFGGSARLDGTAYRAFFENRIHDVTSESWLPGSGCGGAMACARGDKLRLADSFETLQIPGVIRLSLLLHEARHSEGWDHVRCPEGFVRSPYQGADLSGALACDDQAQGAYGIQAVALGNIARSCESCDAETRSQASRFAAFLLQLITDPAARQRLETDLALPQSVVDAVRLSQ